MTNKRFEHSEADIMQSIISTFTDYRIYDYDCEDAYFIKCDEHCVKCLVGLLNQLHQENHYLSTIRENQQQMILKLKEENEQLKKQLKGDNL